MSEKKKDIFIENFEAIRRIAQRILRNHKNFYEVDELINAAYIAYDKAITKRPLLINEQYDRLSTFLFRVKMDMKDYIRDKSKFQIKQRMKDKRIKVPSFYNSFYDNSEDGYKRFISFNTEQGYENIDNIDYLDKILKISNLSDFEWKIIQGYFYDERTIKDVGKNIGFSESRICEKIKEILKRIEISALITNRL